MPDSYIVKKGELLETLTANRDAHREEFLQAQAKYRERVIEHLDARLAEIRNGSKIDVYISLPVPEDHTDDYQAVIDGLEWDTRDEVELNTREFNTLVRNQWAWAPSFAANTQAYTTGQWS